MVPPILRSRSSENGYSVHSNGSHSKVRFRLNKLTPAAPDGFEAEFITDLTAPVIDPETEQLILEFAPDKEVRDILKRAIRRVNNK